MYNRFDSDMLLRQRFLKRMLLMALAFGASFYISTLFFGSVKIPSVIRLTDLSRCPACYGVSVCPELFSDQIKVDTNVFWSSFFNTKNVYYGSTRKNRKVVLKKLAHDWELREFDSKLCDAFFLKRSCKPKDLLNVSNIEETILKLVSYNSSNPGVEARKGVIMCPYPQSVMDFVEPIIDRTGNVQSQLINIWTMLSVNPEPLVLQVISKSKGWHVPAYGGVCGRIELLAYEGEPLSSLFHLPWRRKLNFAKQIIDSALDFTFKHDRYRFYLMDWSLDNIVANEKDVISFVDLEDMVILDKHVSPENSLPDWYKRYSHDLTSHGFSFSIDNLCKHHLSDHNLWAACYVLAGDESPLLYPIPSEVIAKQPYFVSLLHKCLNQDGRLETITKLQQLFNGMLSDN